MVAFWLWTISLIVTVSSRSSKFSRSGNFIKEFWDGSDGKCEPESENGYNRDGCSAGWVKRSGISSGRMVSKSKPSCEFFQRVMTFACPKSSSQNSSIVCWKKVTLYLITPSCSGTWLNWGKCDSECGIGKKKRVKFIASGSGYVKVTESRPCTIRACGRWTEWSDAIKICDGVNCTLVSERRCMYNNSIAPIQFCSTKNTNSNTTVERIQMPCPANACIHTAATTMSSQNTTISKLTAVKNLRSTSINDDSLFPRQSDHMTAEKSDQQSDVWQGIVIGFLTASCVYALICLLVYKKRYKIVLKKSSDSFYNGTLEKPEAAFVQARSELMNNSRNATSHSTMRAATLPSRDLSLRIPSGQLATAFSSFPHLNRRCDEEIEPLYSDIPAFQPTINRQEYGEAAGFRNDNNSVRLEDSEVEDPQPDMFEEDSFDSDEGRDVLRTLRRPSPKLKHRGSSLRQSNQENKSFRAEEEYASNNHCTTHDAGSVKSIFKTSGKGDKAAVSEFQWIGTDHYDSTEPHSDQGGDGSTSNKRYDGRHPSCSSSIASLNIDATTSGYNSSVFDDSTDDEYAMWTKTKPEISRKSRFKRSARLIRKKLSKRRPSRRSVSPPTAAAWSQGYTSWGNQPIPKHPSADLLLHSQSNQNVNNGSSLFDAQRFSTMRPSHQRTFTVFSRNDRMVSVEDIYSSPADAQKPDSTDSPYAGYNVPIDAITHDSSRN